LMKVFPEYSGPMLDWPHVEAVPHAERVLTELRAHWRTALATNAADSDEEGIRGALARVNLDRLIDRVYCFRAIGHRKPSSEFFDAVLSDLGIERRAVFMVGDDFEADVLGANRSGIQAVWLNPASQETRSTKMHRTIHDLRGLPRALEELGLGDEE